jgi:hypothetical protein
MEIATGKTYLQENDRKTMFNRIAMFSACFARIGQ